MQPMNSQELAAVADAIEEFESKHKDHIHVLVVDHPDKAAQFSSLRQCSEQILRELSTRSQRDKLHGVLILVKTQQPNRCVLPPLGMCGPLGSVLTLAALKRGTTGKLRSLSAALRRPGSLMRKLVPW